MPAESPHGTDSAQAAASYLHPGTSVEAVAEIEVKRSHFIGLVKRTATEEQAREFIAEVRQRYPDARHHCSAYIVRSDGAQPIERSNDDGEPAGTAGMPLLDVLRGAGTLEVPQNVEAPPTLDVTVVVVRYFGGVLLGTGGLVRAYQSAAQAALERVRWVRRVSLPVYSFEISIAEAGRVEAEIRQAGITEILVDYSATAAHFTVATSIDLAALLAEVTRGESEPEQEGTRWVDSSWPEPFIGSENGSNVT